jgi:phasin family protein
MVKSSGYPFMDMDISKLMKEFKIPGINIDTMMQSQKKNIEALTEANRIAIEGMQMVTRRQSDILRQTMEETATMMNEIMGTSPPEEKLIKQTEMVKMAFESALVNMKSLSDMVAKSNDEVAKVISKRVSENIEELKTMVAKTEEQNS